MKRLSFISFLPFLLFHYHYVVGFVPALRQQLISINPSATDLWSTNNISAQSSSSSTATKRANTVVREIMTLIKSRYGSEGDWQRTKMYVYRAKKLSVSSVTQVLDFLDSFLSKEVAVTLLKHSPRVLNKPVQSYLRPTTQFLLELWGPELFEQAMLRNPQLLLTSGMGYNQQDTQSPKGKLHNVDDVLTDMTDISATSLQQMKRDIPFVFGLRSQKVQEVLEYMTTILEPTKKGKPILRKLIMGYPYVLNLCVETSLKPRVEFLRATLQLTPNELAKIVRTGIVMGLSVDENLRPTLKYLEEELSLGINLKKCILSHPQLLALSLANIEKKTEFFQSIGPSLAPRIARRCPAVFSLSLDTNIIPTLDFLSRIWGCRWDDSAMEACLTEYPNVLTLSVQGAFACLPGTSRFLSQTI
jgi:hypothetical protein